jgi:hypothetical protein
MFHNLMAYDPISKAWPESVNVINNYVNVSSVGSVSLIDNLSNIIIVVGIFVFFILGFNRILSGLLSVILSCASVKKVEFIERDVNLQTNKDTLLAFCILAVSFYFSDLIKDNYVFKHNYVWLNFVIVLGTISAFLIYKYLIFSLMDWVNNKSIFRYLNRINHTYIAFSLCLCLLGFIIYSFFINLDVKYLYYFIAFIWIVASVMFFKHGYQLFILNGFSHFFWILYLCTLELLPIIF